MKRTKKILSYKIDQQNPAERMTVIGVKSPNAGTRFIIDTEKKAESTAQITNMNQ